MENMKLKSMAALAGCAVLNVAWSDDLNAIYNMSVGSDPTMQQADFVYRATRETKTQAILNLVPIDASANKLYTGVGSATSLILSSWKPPRSRRRAWTSWAWCAMNSTAFTVAETQGGGNPSDRALLGRFAWRSRPVGAARRLPRAD